MDKKRIIEREGLQNYPSYSADPQDIGFMEELAYPKEGRRPVFVVNPRPWPNAVKIASEQ